MSLALEPAPYRLAGARLQLREVDVVDPRTVSDAQDDDNGVVVGD
jgi:hypothetical protein